MAWGHACFICGVLVSQANVDEDDIYNAGYDSGASIWDIVYPPWQSVGRTVYCQSFHKNEIAVSGVNKCVTEQDDDSYLFPQNENDESENNQEARLTQGVTVSPGAPWPSSPDLDDQEPNLNILPAYLVHESCWKIAQACALPSKIPIKALFWLLASFPRQLKEFPRSVDFGHTYGLTISKDGIYQLENTNDWDVDSVDAVDGESGMEDENEEDDNHLAWLYDPIDIPGLSVDLTRASHNEKQKPVAESTQDRQTLKHQNLGHSTVQASKKSFACLPTECVLRVLKEIPTSDIPALQKALEKEVPGFSAISGSRDFWRTRFEPGGESCLFFETRDSTGNLRKGDLDWEGIHKIAQRTSKKGRLAIRNRRRIYHLVENLLELVMKIHHNHSALPEFHFEKPGGLSYYPKYNERHPDLHWCVVSSSIAREYPYNTNVVLNEEPERPCRLIFQDTKLIPDEVIKIGISSIKWNKQNYICGIRFVASEAHMSIECGYMTKTSETIVDIALLGGKFLGFKLALGEDGIYSAKVITTREESPWSNNDSRSGNSTTNRLSILEDPKYLTLGLDGFKICHIGLGYEKTSAHYTPAWSLQNRALWHPEPPSCLHQLCGAELPDQAKYMENANFLPLSYCTFARDLVKDMGNPGHLCKITAFVRPVDRMSQVPKLLGLQFHYRRIGDHFNTKYIFGYDGNDIKYHAWHQDTTSIITYVIDWAAGETIDGFSYEQDHDLLTSLTISTTRFRYLFVLKNSGQGSGKTKIIRRDPTHQIMGICGHILPDGIGSIGMITKEDPDLVAYFTEGIEKISKKRRNEKDQCTTDDST